MNFALLVANLPDVYQVQYAKNAQQVFSVPTVTTLSASLSAIKRLISHLLPQRVNN